MKKTILLISAMLFWVSGCLELEQEIFLNTDGSGKIILNMKYSPMFAMEFSAYDQQTPDSNSMIKEMVRQMLDNNNILAWENIECGHTDKGGLFFKATAFFENLSDMSNFGSRMYFSALGNLKIKRTDEGRMLLQESSYDYEDKEENKDVIKKTELTDSQIDFKLKQLKAQLQQSKIMMDQYMGDFRYKIILHLPGVIEDANVFTVVDENTVLFEMEGRKVMQEYDKLLADDDKLREMAKGGDEYMLTSGMGEKSMRKIVIGTDDTMRVVVVPDASMNVDYKKDIKTAKANFSNIVKKFGIEYVEPIEVKIDPNDVPEIIQVDVIGANLMYKSAIKDNEPGFRGSRRYDFQEPHYQIHMFVDFSCPVSEIKTIKIESVVDNKGKELVKENRSSYPDYFSADKTRVKFDVSLDLPGEQASSINSLQGTITCVSLSKIEKADLGFIELKKNAVTANGDVKITYMHKIEDFDPGEEGSEAGSIFFEIANHGYKIHDIKLLDVNGVELNACTPCCSGVRIESSRNKTRLTMEFGQVIPDVAQIVVERTKHFAEYELPFGIENISLLGKPMVK